ncbi:F0F1 ATP synthase subunit B family protein [Pararhodospirillum oryzae]|uniref:ATP synthase subunit b n=1 Tax=Pararhodospirillum oryzae TaxID=478448 RepID=A0A512H5E7_9PROT|nr:F0F1 ATP synthase subunit B' [Pararhodospirillum oryzae]GEO80689.1 ATP synthase subunit b 2 [Pararhodospirillum oryzae]
MPQFDFSTFPSQILWLVITIFALYLVMTRMAIPRLAEVLDQRQKMMDDDLEQAERLKSQTEAAIAAYETALAEARAKAHAEIRAVTEAADRATAERTAEVNARLAVQIKDGETRIVKARDAALANVREVAATVAQGIVSRLAGLSLDTKRVDGAVATALKEHGR